MTAGAPPFPPEVTSYANVAPPKPTRRTRSFWNQVLIDVVRSGGARIGLTWIGLLAFGAVFAPFLANTQPILVKIDGHWSSPLLQYIDPADVTLLLFVLFAAIALWLRRVSVGRRILSVTVMTLIAGIACACLLHPPETVDWQKFRDLKKQGRIQFELNTPLPFSPNDFQRDNPDARLQPPDAAHPLGTEGSGADVLSRMLHASRVALSIGLISTGISVIIGITVGGVLGYFSGIVDLVGMRVIELFEAIPPLFLIIAFVAFFGRNIYMIMAILGFTGWTDEARYIRAEFFRLRKQDFVQAAIAGGLPLPSILFRHLLPNGISPILITSSFGIASAILYESTLSFLGLGVVEQPSWGELLEQSRSVGGTFVWWMAVFPGLAIFLTVFSYNLIGEAMRDALDPRLLKRE